MDYLFAYASDPATTFAPTLLVILALSLLVWELTHRRERVTIDTPMPRAPGESLRLGLEEMNEQLVVRMLATVSIAAITGMAVKAVSSQESMTLVYGVLFAGSALALALALWTWQLVKGWQESQFGYEGKRIVGRELNLLMLDGCRVFHDLVNSEVGNVDHVIVAPQALYVVETYTRGKDGGQADDGPQTVEYDGEKLHFASSTTRRPVEQARLKAEWLERHIARQAGITLPVHPILVLPGWKVQTSESGVVEVVSPAELGGTVVDKAAQPIWEAQRQRVIHLLDEECSFTPLEKNRLSTMAQLRGLMQGVQRIKTRAQDLLVTVKHAAASHAR